MPDTPATHAAQAIRQMPWRIPLNPDRPTEPLPPEGVAAIHDAAMRILEEIGIEFLNAEARDYLARRRLRASTGDNVRMDRGFVMEQVAKAPRQFDITPRNPERRVTMGGGHMCFVNVSSPPNAWISTAAAGSATSRVPRPHQADAVFQLHPCRGRLSGRAGRHPRLGPPPRLPL